MSCVKEGQQEQRRKRLSKLSYLQGRGLEYLLTISVILGLNFLLPRLMPGDPFSYLSGIGSSSDLAATMDAKSEAILRAYYGLDQPWLQQFFHYLSNLVQGNLGYAYYFKAPVAQLIAERLPWSLLLVVSSILLASLLGIAMGVFSAWKRGTAWDTGCWAVFLSLRAIPTFFLGTLLLLFLSFHSNLFPLFGAYSIEQLGSSWLVRLKDILWHLTLPVTTLTLAEITAKYLLTRGAMLDTLEEDYITFARARGMEEEQIMYKHALPNALLPVVTQIALRLGMAAAGMIYVETIFGYPGMGKLMQDALAVRDFQVLQGTFLITSVMVLALNFLLDLCYVYLDPRVEVR